jgi:hypothetical protein
VAFPRCDKRLRGGGGDPVWWGSQTSTGATLESVWKWRAPSTTRVRARACCRWRRCGFAWPTGCRLAQKTNPIRSKVEVPLARSRPRALTMPAPSRAGPGGGDRSRPVRPGAGIPRQNYDIVRTGPLWRQPGRQQMRSGCMRAMPPGTASANNSAARQIQASTAVLERRAVEARRSESRGGIVGEAVALLRLAEQAGFHLRLVVFRVEHRDRIGSGRKSIENAGRQPVLDLRDRAAQFVSGLAKPAGEE